MSKLNLPLYRPIQDSLNESNGEDESPPVRQHGAALTPGPIVALPLRRGLTCEQSPPSSRKKSFGQKSPPRAIERPNTCSPHKSNSLLRHYRRSTEKVRYAIKALRCKRMMIESPEKENAGDPFAPAEPSAFLQKRQVMRKGALKNINQTASTVANSREEEGVREIAFLKRRRT